MIGTNNMINPRHASTRTYQTAIFHHEESLQPALQGEIEPPKRALGRLHVGLARSFRLRFSR